METHARYLNCARISWLPMDLEQLNIRVTDIKGLGNYRHYGRPHCPGFILFFTPCFSNKLSPYWWLKTEKDFPKNMVLKKEFILNDDNCIDEYFRLYVNWIKQYNFASSEKLIKKIIVQNSLLIHFEDFRCYINITT